MVLRRDREEEQEENSKPCCILSFEFTYEIPILQIFEIIVRTELTFIECTLFTALHYNSP